jgi:hypothetical protein
MIVKSLLSLLFGALYDAWVKWRASHAVAAQIAKGNDAQAAAAADVNQLRRSTDVHEQAIQDALQRDATVVADPGSSLRQQNQADADATRRANADDSV